MKQNFNNLGLAWQQTTFWMLHITMKGMLRIFTLHRERKKKDVGFADVKLAYWPYTCLV